jgi:prepilin-type N-terminal cleavage/methylation domain-containing protein
MRRSHSQLGFSLLELLVAVALLLIVVAATLSAFNQALRANEAVASMADLNQNLRAGMNYMVRDLVQCAEGLPTGGIPIPSGGSNGPINRPGPAGLNYTFDPTFTTLPSVVPGPGMGPVVLRATDMITILYADSTLPLQVNPINSASNPVCNGTIAADGSFVTFDSNCTKLTVGNISVGAGDLIMFSNAQGNVLQAVTSVAGQTLHFDKGDPFNLNGRSDPQGTIEQLQTPFGSGVYPPTTATRVWMITYYLDATTDPKRPALLRQVNFNTPRPVGEVLEDLQISYDVVDGATNPTDVKQPAPPDTPNQIRKVNLYLAGRSDAPYTLTNTFFRNNLLTQVSLRSMSFVSRYQ